MEVEVQEDATPGLVRTTVKDVVRNRYLSDVHVKVIGSRNDDFVSGATDLRGVFVGVRIVLVAGHGLLEYEGWCCAVLRLRKMASIAIRKHIP